ncbi:DegT/DnrJ/EryC1/StrS family aminotransferase [Alphaproteobacteria bacterium]|nr:DegT/DnrJ/EryC1/StrS family aminotransferase [Alphaproteobacteria bacterium]
MKFKFPLATTTWDNKEKEAIRRVVESNYFTMGSQVFKFEKMFANYFGAKHAVMVNSGSSANLIMTAALFYTSNSKYRLNPGDEIIVPAVSWPTTYFPLTQYGLKLKFVDIDIHTLNYNLADLAAAVNKKTKALMVVNLLGNPNEFDALQKIIAGREIILIEDNCESMDASYKQKKTGTFGLMASFSSFFSHHISTMEGGVVLTDDEELHQILLSLRSHGWTRNLPNKNILTGKKSIDAFEESFKFILPGYNLRPLEMSGAIGIEQIKKLPSITKGRRTNAKYFVKQFSNHPRYIIQSEIGKSSWFGFSLVIRPELNLERKKVLRTLKDNGFECRPIVSGNFTKHEVMKYLDYTIHSNLKNADYIDNNGLFVGNHHYPIEDAIEILFKIL